VAVGTSLPELATSVVAARRGKGDIAVGNAVGSSIFNLLGILGTTVLVQPLSTQTLRWVDTGVMIATAVIILPLFRSDWTLSRIEGTLLLIGYGVYVASLLLL
jgi:cation:H+ antiporter